jgi:hypothetical protein
VTPVPAAVASEILAADLMWCHVGDGKADGKTHAVQHWRRPDAWNRGEETLLPHLTWCGTRTLCGVYAPKPTADEACQNCLAQLAPMFAVDTP